MYASINVYTLHVYTAASTNNNFYPWDLGGRKTPLVVCYTWATLWDHSVLYWLMWCGFYDLTSHSNCEFAQLFAAVLSIGCWWVHFWLCWLLTIVMDHCLSRFTIILGWLIFLDIWLRRLLSLHKAPTQLCLQCSPERWLHWLLCQEKNWAEDVSSRMAMLQSLEKSSFPRNL